MGLLALLAALCMLPGCSAIKLAYRNAPDLLYWWVDGYADLGEAQSLQVRADLARLHQWHRSTELPRIAELLRRTQQQASGDVTAEQVCALYAETRTRVYALVAQAEPTATSLAMGLRPEQLAHIETRFAKVNIEWRDEWISGSQKERQGKRLKLAVERSEQFYGTLEERQVAVLRSAMANADFDPVLSYSERLRRQQDLLQILRFVSGSTAAAKPTVARATEALRGYLERTLASPDPAYRAYFDKALADNCASFANLHNSATPEQRTRALRRLAAYERDARELSAVP